LGIFHKKRSRRPVSRVLSPCKQGRLSFIYACRHRQAPAVYPPTWGEQPSLMPVYMTLQLLRCTARTSLCGWWALTPPSHPYLPV